ncbi:MAG: hypothetical protein H0X30_15430 [Anaerolineae bacterium]|nr:hypothetical protein [Anaerolineae bacterium]
MRKGGTLISRTQPLLQEKAVNYGVQSIFFYAIDIRGSNGKLILRGRNFLQFEIEISSKVMAAYSAPTIIRPVVRHDNIQMMLLPELEEFASAIKEKRSPLITAVDGRRVLKVLDAVIASGKSHLPVALTI